MLEPSFFLMDIQKEPDVLQSSAVDPFKFEIILESIISRILFDDSAIVFQVKYQRVVSSSRFLIFSLNFKLNIFSFIVFIFGVRNIDMDTKALNITSVWSKHHFYGPVLISLHFQRIFGQVDNIVGNVGPVHYLEKIGVTVILFRLEVPEAIKSQNYDN